LTLARHLLAPPIRFATTVAGLPGEFAELVAGEFSHRRYEVCVIGYQGTDSLFVILAQMKCSRTPIQPNGEKVAEVSPFIVGCTRTRRLSAPPSAGHDGAAQHFLLSGELKLLSKKVPGVRHLKVEFIARWRASLQLAIWASPVLSVRSP